MSSADEQQAIALLEAMVRIPSRSHHETELAHVLVAEMRARGFNAFVDTAGNAVGIIGAGPEIVLLGHIDTVAGEVPVRMKDGRLYGRGAVDAKGPSATFVSAAARLHAAGMLNKRLVLVGAVEEEAATSKGAHFAATQYRPAACIIGEPSGWEKITLGYKGRLLLDASWAQGAAHSAGPARAVAKHAVAFWNAVAAHCGAHNAQHTRLFDQLLPSLRAIQTSGDGLTEVALLTIGIRLPPAIGADLLAAQLATLATDGRAPTELHFRDMCPAYQSPRDTPLARALLGSIRAAGGTPGFLLKTGTSDMNVVGPAWGCPIVAYGPGDSALDHTPHEHIVLDEYLRGITVLCSALSRLIC